MTMFEYVDKMSTNQQRFVFVGGTAENVYRGSGHPGLACCFHIWLMRFITQFLEFCFMRYLNILFHVYDLMNFSPIACC